MLKMKCWKVTKATIKNTKKATIEIIKRNTLNNIREPAIKDINEGTLKRRYRRLPPLQWSEGTMKLLP